MCSILKATSLEGNIKMWQNYPTFHLITPFNICFIEHLINNKTMGVKKNKLDVNFCNTGTHGSPQ